MFINVVCVAALLYGNVMPPALVSFGFAPIVRAGRSTIPAHSYVRLVHPNLLSLHEIIKSMAYNWAPTWENIIAGDWHVWQARSFVDMSEATEPLAFMTYPGAICVTEPGRLHAPLLVASPDACPGYEAARVAALARLPPIAHVPADATLISLYFHNDAPVSFKIHLKIKLSDDGTRSQTCHNAIVVFTVMQKFILP
jgi:hypothetical protein